MLNEKKLKFLIIWGIAIVLCSGFLQMHFSSDTYVLWDLGYMNYPQQYFLLDGRLISAFVCFFAGILNLPLEVYIIGMTFIGIFFLSFAIYITSDILNEFVKKQTTTTNVFIVAISFVLVVCQFNLEYLLFPESAVMCLGVLLVVYAAKISLLKTTKRYLKIFALLLTAVLCYQGLVNIFPTFIMLIFILRHITTIRLDKAELKKIIIDIFKLALITIVVVVISFGVVEAGKALFQSEQDRTNDIFTQEGLERTVEALITYTDDLWHKNLNMLPHYFNYVIIGATILFLFLLKSKKTIIAEYLLFVLCILIICIVPMFLFNTGPVGRVNSPMAMLFGSSLAIIYITSLQADLKKIKRSIEIFVAISFMLNSVFIIANISEHLAANKIDQNMGRTLNHYVEQYEQQTGITLTKFSFIYDINPEQFAPDIRAMSSFTERAFAVPWSLHEAMNYYTGKKFERVYLGQTLNEDIDLFLENQILFEDDTIHLIVY